MDMQSTVALHTGRKMPVSGLGTWKLTDDTAGTIEHALQLGYKMIDTSGDYGTQSGIGEGLIQSGVSRDDFYLVTKIEETDIAFDVSLQNLAELQLAYADLILIHRPPLTGAGEDLWRGLIRAKEEGLTKDIGVSNYSMDLIQTLIDEAGEVPVVNQIEWSPFGYSDDMLQYSADHKIVIQAYSPLVRAKRLDDATLRDVAAKYNKTPAQVLIRWNLELGTVPLPKANKREHLEENIDVFDFEISEEDMDRLGGLNEQYSSLGTLSYV